MGDLVDIGSFGWGNHLNLRASLNDTVVFVFCALGSFLHESRNDDVADSFRLHLEERMGESVRRGETFCRIAHQKRFDEIDCDRRYVFPVLRRKGVVAGLNLFENLGDILGVERWDA